MTEERVKETSLGDKMRGKHFKNHSSHLCRRPSCQGSNKTVDRLTHNEYEGETGRNKRWTYTCNHLTREPSSLVSFRDAASRHVSCLPVHHADVASIFPNKASKTRGRHKSVDEVFVEEEQRREIEVLSHLLLLLPASTEQSQKLLLSIERFKIRLNWSIYVLSHSISRLIN